MAKPANKTLWNTSEPIDLSQDDEPTWNKWPGRQNAPSIVGVDRARFRELVIQQQIQEYKAPDGSIRYNPKDLAELRDEFAFEETTENPSFAVAGVQIEGMKTANDVLRLQMEFNKQLMGVLIESQQSITKSQNVTIEHLTRTLEFYQKERLTFLKEQGETKIQELVLGIEAQDKEQQEARRAMIINAVAPHVGPLIASITESVRSTLGGAPPKAPPAPPPVEPATSDAVHAEPPPKTELGAQAEKLLRSVGKEKLGMLAAAGLLDDEDSELLHSIMSQMVSAEPNQEETKEDTP